MSNLAASLFQRSLHMRFEAPPPLHAGRLVFALDESRGLSKTTANFVALCTGDKGTCKNAPNKELHYLDCPIHRVVKGFVAQGGDITRGDGSGGEVSPCPRFLKLTDTEHPSSQFTVENLTMRKKV